MSSTILLSAVYFLLFLSVQAKENQRVVSEESSVKIDIFVSGEQADGALKAKVTQLGFKEQRKCKIMQLRT